MTQECQSKDAVLAWLAEAWCGGISHFAQLTVSRLPWNPPSIVWFLTFHGLDRSTNTKEAHSEDPSRHVSTGLTAVWNLVTLAYSIFWLP